MSPSTTVDPTNLITAPHLEAYRREVERFVRASWTDDPDRDPIEFRRRAIREGHLLRTLPARWGGAGRDPDYLAARIAHSTLARCGAPTIPVGVGPALFVPTVLQYGTDEQRERWVLPTLVGQLTWCQGYSEPEAGSDLASLRTRATRDGDQWLLTGHKIWSSDADQADLMFCLARTDPGAPRRAGITMFVVDLRTPGVTVAPIRQITGETDFAEVFLDGVAVPDDCRIGEVNHGWAVSTQLLGIERESTGGTLFEEFDALLALAEERDAASDRRIALQLLDVETRLLAFDVNQARLCEPDVPESTIRLPQLVSKLMSTNLIEMMANVAGEILGAEALTAPEPDAYLSVPTGVPGWRRQWYRALAFGIAGGASNIQRNIIADRGLVLERAAKARS